MTMAHTVHMSHPIRTGTARRLGLRPPKPQPRGRLVLTRPLTDAEVTAFREKWQAAIEKEPWGRVIHDFPEIRTELPLHTLRRRWWQRRNR